LSNTKAGGIGMAATNRPCDPSRQQHVAALLEAATPLLDGWLGTRDSIRLTSCCKRLRAAEGVPLALSSLTRRSQWVLQLAAASGRRFQFTAVCVTLTESADFDALAALPALRDLSVRRTSASAADIHSIASVKTAQSLTSLDLGRGCCASLADLSPLSSCVALTSLSVDSAAVRDLTGLARCPSLRSLKLHSMPHLADLTPLSARGSHSPWVLDSLSLRGCVALTDISPLAHLSHLRCLSLALCTGLHADRGLEPLARLPRLTELTLTGCSQLRTVAPLAQCPALQTLYLTGCSSLSEVAPLAEAPCLTTLHLNKCRALSDVSALGTSATLRLLNLRCSGARVVPHREGLELLFDTVWRKVSFG
jgi:hypothetical protein